MTTNKTITLMNINEEMFEDLKEYLEDCEIDFRIEKSDIVNKTTVVDTYLHEVSTAFKQLKTSMENAESIVHPLINSYTIDHVLSGIAELEICITEQTRFNGLFIDLGFKDSTYEVDSIETMLNKLEDSVNDLLHGDLARYIGPILVLSTIGVNPSDKLLKAIHSRELILPFLNYDHVNTVEIFNDEGTYSDFITNIEDPQGLNIQERYAFMFTYEIEEDHTSS